MLFFVGHCVVRTGSCQWKSDYELQQTDTIISFINSADFIVVHVASLTQIIFVVLEVFVPQTTSICENMAKKTKRQKKKK